MSDPSSFIQFVYCPLCRLNYKKSRKHVYSKRHQEVIKNILKKFSSKIQKATSTVSQPLVKVISSGEDETTCFWCYFCGKDVVMHTIRQTVRGEVCITNGGMLEHISGTDHSLAMDQFFKENRVDDAERKKTFVISSQLHMKFIEDAYKECELCLDKKAAELKKMCAVINQQTHHRHATLHSAALDKTPVKAPQSFLDEIKTQNIRSQTVSVDVDGERKRTLRAFGEGLTALDRTKEDDSLGNIYTNALPPWLLPNDGDVTRQSGKVGPDVEDWSRHLKQKAKASLSADRVGAKFDRGNDLGGGTLTSDDWLPSFGGVWSNAARKHSGKHFHKTKPFNNGRQQGSMSNEAGDPLCQTGLSSGHIKELQNPRCPTIGNFATNLNELPLPNSFSSLKTSQMTSDSMYNSNITHMNYDELSSMKQPYLNSTSFSNSPNDVKYDYSAKASCSKISHNPNSVQNSHPPDYNHHIHLNNLCHVNQQYTKSYSHSQQCTTNHYVPMLQQDYDGTEGSQTVNNNSVTVKLKPYIRKYKSHVTNSGSLALNTLPYPPTISYHQGVQSHSVYQRHFRPTSPTGSITPCQKALINPKGLPVSLIPTPVLKHKHSCLK